jgi:hypothetical protein
VKLFRVRCVVNLVVLAEDEPAALEIAEREAEAEASNGLQSMEIAPVDRIEDLPSGWRGSYPYGGDGEATCREILERQQPPTAVTEGK